MISTYFFLYVPIIHVVWIWFILEQINYSTISIFSCKVTLLVCLDTSSLSPLYKFLYISESYGKVVSILKGHVLRYMQAGHPFSLKSFLMNALFSYKNTIQNMYHCYVITIFWSFWSAIFPMKSEWFNWIGGNLQFYYTTCKYVLPLKNWIDWIISRQEKNITTSKLKHLRKGARKLKTILFFHVMATLKCH